MVGVFCESMGDAAFNSLRDLLEEDHHEVTVGPGWGDAYDWVCWVTCPSSNRVSFAFGRNELDALLKVVKQFPCCHTGQRVRDWCCWI